MKVLVSHTNVLDNYNESFINLNLIDKIIFPYTSFKELLFLPYRSKVYIENIHKFAWVFFIRLDLIVVHVPRGGGTFKLGWRDVNINKIKKLFVIFKLKRRDYIIVSSPIFIDYLQHAEYTASRKFLLAKEPINSTMLYCNTKEKIETVLIALGECGTEEDYNYIESMIYLYSNDISVIRSYHPILNKSNAFTYDMNNVDLLITDTTTLSISAFYKNKKFIIINSDIKGNRSFYNNISFFYKNVCEKSDLLNVLNDEIYSEFNFKLTNQSIGDLNV